MIHATDFLNEADYWDAVHEEAMGPSTMAEVDRAEALTGASEEECWVLSGRDVWYRNPNYRGTVQPHPEEAL